MKKSTLQITHQFDFDLLGLVAPLKDYKMAWIINKSLGFELTKVADFQLEFVSQPNLIISQYLQKKEHGYIQLLKNRCYSDSSMVRYLIPELKLVDYFLIMQDFTYQMDLNSYIEDLSTNSLIQNVVKLDITKLKSKENLLTY